MLSLPVDGPHVGPLGHLEGKRGPNITPPPDHRLPSGKWCFRVTQTFDNPDFYWVNHGRPNAKHNALDLGNHTCGERVLAMDSGKAFAGIDSAGALYVVIDHGNQHLTRYWHLRSWTAPVRKGVWVQVNRGQQIGVVGDTGLGAVCHLHIEEIIKGVKVDPWPHLAQNQGQEDDLMFFGSDDYDHFNARGTCLQGARLRSKPSTKEGEVVHSFSAGQVVQIYARARGPRTETLPDNPWWYLVSGWVTGKGYIDGGWMAHITFSKVAKAELPVTTVPDEALGEAVDASVIALEGAVNVVQRGARQVTNAVNNLKEARK